MFGKRQVGIACVALLFAASAAIAQTPVAPAPPSVSAGATSQARTPEELAAAAAARAAAQAKDWPNLARYKAANAALPAPSKAQPRVVILGDSITQNWRVAAPVSLPRMVM